MARQFPEITNFGSAFRFVLEAEAAAGDFAAAADALSPSEEWHTRLEELVCTHRDRVSKLTIARQEVNEMILEPVSDFDGSGYLAALGADPVMSWPAIVEQLIAAEENVARFEEDFVEHGEDMLAATGRVFKKAAKQNVAAAAQLREMLG